jgi:hypothetical protein
MYNQLPDNPSVFWLEGFEAGKKRRPVEDNPYLINALFDTLQRGEDWNQGRKYGLETRYPPRRKFW